MAKAVLISIRPEWAAKILSGIKTAEVRRNRPKLEPPFKCYIYCTMPNTHNPHKVLEIHSTDGRIRRANGKIIGEFVCDKISRITHIGTNRADVRLVLYEAGGRVKEIDFTTIQMGLTELEHYLNRDDGFIWNISNLYIYDNPRLLSDFWLPPETYCEKGMCGSCPHDCCPSEYGDVLFDCEWKRPLKRPPQSWCYVEEV